MHIIQAIILGIVQGLTEFIPVSSSGHLLFIEKLFHWDTTNLAFDIAVHWGTLLALLWFFRKDWLDILTSFARRVVRREPYGKASDASSSGRYAIPIVIASIPAAVVGVALDSKIEAMRDRVWMLPALAGALVFVGLVMLLAERVGKRQREMTAMNYVDYVAIGIAQAVALFPGVSRSGITISTGLFRDLDRAAAARFSFLLSTPVIFGAGLKALWDLRKTGFPTDQMALFVVGFLAAAISGYVAIRFLMNYLQRGSLKLFAIYRFVLAAAILVVFFIS